MFIIVFQLLLLLISHYIKLSPIISPCIYKYIYVSIYIYIRIYIYYAYFMYIIYVYYMYIICILYMYIVYIYIYSWIIYIYICIYTNPMISDDLPLTTILWAGTVRHPRWCLRLRIPWNFGQFLEVPWALFCFARVRVGFQERGILAWNNLYIYI